MVTIFSAIAEGTRFLKDNNIDTPRLDCEVILSYVLSISRLKLLTEAGSFLENEHYKRYKELLRLRLEGMPVAYISGVKEFMSLNFAVAPGILIPRGDTEIVVEKVIEECRKRKECLKVADVCCGSGAIGLSVAKYAENVMVTLMDISDKAIEFTVLNASKNDVADRVKVLKGDLLLPVINEKFDIIVSNPPYIETGVIPTLQREVKDYEPRIALDGGEDGLVFYRRLSIQAFQCLKDDGVLIYEIGCNQSDAALDILMRNGFKDIEVYKDLAGSDRCIMGRKI